MFGFCSGTIRTDVLPGRKELFCFYYVLLAINVIYKLSEREGFFQKRSGYHIVLRLNTVIQKDAGKKDW